MIQYMVFKNCFAIIGTTLVNFFYETVELIARNRVDALACGYASGPGLEPAAKCWLILSAPFPLKLHP